MIKLRKYLSTKGNRTDGNFVGGMVREMIILYIFLLSFTNCFVCKADLFF